LIGFLIIIIIIDTPVLKWFTPTEGPNEGGTIITLFGYNFFKSSYLYCKFGETVVPANFTRKEDGEPILICVAPSGKIVTIFYRHLNNILSLHRIWNSASCNVRK
jgi:hypothetical protein